MSNIDFTPVLKRFAVYGKLIFNIFSTMVLTRKQKLLLGAGLAYLLSPIDLVPGFVPVLGQLDDIIVALTVLVKILKDISPQQRNSYLEKFELTLDIIERDLAVCKAVAADLAKKAAAHVTKVAYAGGKAALSLAARGIFTAAKGAAKLVNTIPLHSGERLSYNEKNK
nr:YkvA family protein [Desulfofalx alkaliphila]